MEIEELNKLYYMVVMIRVNGGLGKEKDHRLIERREEWGCRVGCGKGEEYL